ncbi:hypothetical protein J6590_039932 [Homalodisca vitripennis]|nr:hypothetical protein J6590_039932 [Homalodisca vitripennis]
MYEGERLDTKQLAETRLCLRGPEHNRRTSSSCDVTDPSLSLTRGKVITGHPLLVIPTPLPSSSSHYVRELRFELPRRSHNNNAELHGTKKFVHK